MGEGLDLAASRLGRAMTFDRAGGVSSHQPSRSRRVGSRGRLTGMGMIFAMARRCPAGWQRVCPTRSGFADFCAGFTQALVSGVWSFYGLRFLLGVAEAGFFPGIILYLTYWYPAEYRARFLAAFAIAVPVSSVIGAPVSGLLLGLDGAMGLKGWQWLFVIEGIPSVLLGIVTWFYLTDRPAKADWLTAEQKAWLSSRLESEIAAKKAAQHLTLGQALCSPKVITLSLIYFGFVAALYGMQFWLPQIVKAFGFTNAQTGFVTAVPYLFGTVAMILWARHSDATRERVMHVGAPLLLTAAGARDLRLHG